jgi:hypothetical protein
VKRWEWGAAAAVVVVLVGVPAGLMKIAINVEEAAFREQLRLARAEGLPTTAAEFTQQILPAAPEENAAPLYRELRGQIPRQVDLESLARQLTFQPDPEVMAGARAFLKQAEAPLQTIDAAVRLPRCWYDRDWSKGVVLLLPELADMRMASRLLALRGSLAAAEGRTDAAIQDARRILQIAAHANDEPSAMHRNLMESIEREALDHLAFWSFRYRGVPDYVRELERVCDASTPPDLKRELSGVLHQALGLVDMIQTQEGIKEIGMVFDEPDLTAKVGRQFLNQRRARIDLVKSGRAFWAALESPPDRRADLLHEADQDFYRALLAFPPADQLHGKLISWESIAFVRVDAWEARRLRYVAAARALSQRTIPKTMDTMDLLSPFDGEPVLYSYPNGQIVIHIGGKAGELWSLKIPPDPAPAHYWRRP